MGKNTKKSHRIARLRWDGTKFLPAEFCLPFCVSFFERHTQKHCCCCCQSIVDDFFVLFVSSSLKTSFRWMFTRRRRSAECNVKCNNSVTEFWENYERILREFCEDFREISESSHQTSQFSDLRELWEQQNWFLFTISPPKHQIPLNNSLISSLDSHDNQKIEKFERA